MSQVNSRKRPAPGASPIIQQQAPSNYNLTSPQMANDLALQWNQEPSINTPSSYPETTNDFNHGLYNGLTQAQVTPQAIPSPTSNQLTRRPLAQHVVSRGPYNATSGELWPGMADGGFQQAQGENWVNELDDLDQKAAVAKRDSQAKRKQIPPFVQKLSSFLDESRNTDLIRWSASGDSFIVVDEDEFAKNLIPELFKHRNYASFVRQLNMYGFHKKVGLSDNSMRASERKDKSPSEYYNPYFKRGRPNLLWLIQKPKNPPGKGKSGRGKPDDTTFDDDVDEKLDVGSPAPVNNGIGEPVPILRNGRHPLMIGQGGGQSGNGVPADELAAVHRELQAVRQSQHQISTAISNIRREHEQLYGQAAAFQEVHSKHENSINAILTFLATVYSRNLEGHGAQNLANMFAGAIPQDNQAKRNVVDIDDFADQGNHQNSQPRRFLRKPLLLGAPPSPNGESDVASIPSPAVSVESPYQPPQTSFPGTTERNVPFSRRDLTPTQPGAIQEIFDQDPAWRSSKTPETQIPESEILSMINSANANDQGFPGTRMDFSQALSHLQTAGGKSPLTPHQRTNALQLMANDSANTSQNGNHTALTTPVSSQMAVPGMERWNSTKEELDFLERSLREQDCKVANLSSMLQPLSPSGSIPGLTDSQGYGGSDALDLDQIFNSGDYFNDTGGAGGDIDFSSGHGVGDFNLEGGMDAHNMGLQDSFGLDGADERAGRIVETVNSSEATSPANTVDDGGGGDTLDERVHPAKRRRGNGS